MYAALALRRFRGLIRKLLICAGGSLGVVGCLVSFDDYPVESAGGSGGSGGSGAIDGSGAMGGTSPDGAWPTGGSSGLGGASGSGGTSGVGGGSDATDGTPPLDAPADQTTTPCQILGFWTEPVNPTAAGFTVFFESEMAFICIRFEVTCNGVADLTPHGALDGAGCLSAPYCWGANVSECNGGTVNVAFYRDAGTGAGYCNDTFGAGSPGVLVAGCQFTLAP